MKAYWDSLTKEQQGELTGKAGPTPGYLWLVFNGYKRANFVLAKKLEQCTSGVITKSDLRPNIYALQLVGCWRVILFRVIYMNGYVYSARHNAFSPMDTIDKYRSAGRDLSDAEEVNQNIVSEFMAEPPQGKVRIIGEDGLPAWTDTPPPAHEKPIEITESERQLLISQANEHTNDKQWPDKTAIGRLEGEEPAQHNLWLDYLDALELIDISGAPDIERLTPSTIQAR